MLHLNPCWYVCYVIRRCLGLFVSVITELTVLQTDFDGLSVKGIVSNCSLTNIWNPIGVESLGVWRFDYSCWVEVFDGGTFDDSKTFWGNGYWTYLIRVVGIMETAVFKKIVTLVDECSCCALKVWYILCCGIKVPHVRPRLCNIFLIALAYCVVVKFSCWGLLITYFLHWS